MFLKEKGKRKTHLSEVVLRHLSIPLADYLKISVRR